MKGLLIRSYTRFCDLHKACANRRGEPAAAAGEEPLLPLELGEQAVVPVAFEIDRQAWSLQNDRFRRTALSWLQSRHPSALARLMIMRLCIAPVHTPRFKRVRSGKGFIHNDPSNVVAHCMDGAVVNHLMPCAGAFHRHLSSAMVTVHISLCRKSDN